MADRVLLLSVGDSLASDAEIARWVTTDQNASPVTGVAFDGWALSQNDAVVAENNGGLVALSSSQLPFLSTNLIQTDDVRLFDAYRLLESDGHCIALVGLTPAFSSAQLRSEEPVQAVVEAMKEVDNMADVVIILSDADRATNLAVASTVHGIDVIIAGGEATREVSVDPATGALIFSPGYPGRSMGVARIMFDSHGHVQNYQWDRTLYLPAQ